jgi:transaldolase
MMVSVLEQLQEMTVIVADTGDAKLVEKHKPQDGTTNPSLVLAALNSSDGQDLIDQELNSARSLGLDAPGFCDTLTVAIGANLTTLVPGRVSTEVDANLSFDTDGSVRRANEIIEEYDRRGISSDRILIKLASTWEGIRAAERLQRDGIDCNLTLLFALEQAMACADAGVFLISPFVGRITDWYKKAERVAEYAPDEDPGVLSVREIYQAYKARSISTIVMGASFRSTAQVKALAGCDRLTIAPKLLEALANDKSELERALVPQASGASQQGFINEMQFRWGMNTNAMAMEKLAEGIRGFDADHRKLIELLSTKL